MVLWPIRARVLFELFYKESKYTEKSFNDDVIYTSVLQ